MAISSLRRKLAAALLLPTAALTLAACGGDTDFVIHDNDSFDMKIVAWDDSGLDLLDKDTCSEDGMKSRGMGTSSLPSGVTPTYTFGDKDGHPSCTVEMNGVKLSDMESSKGEGIKHEGDTFTFDMDISGFQDSQYKSSGITSSLSVTFPGEVTEHNGSSTVDGTKVTWKDIITESETNLHAAGKDKGNGDSGSSSSSSNMPLILGIGGGVLALIIAGVVIAIIASKKKKAAASALPYGAPAAPGQPMQPGYDPTAGYGAAPQAGYPQQGYGPAVPPQDGQQGYQQPYNNQGGQY